MSEELAAEVARLRGELASSVATARMLAGVADRQRAHEVRQDEMIRALNAELAAYRKPSEPVGTMTTDVPPPGDPTLLPCPFCGGSAFLHEQPPHEHGLMFDGVKWPDHPGSFTVECHGCGIGLIQDERADAIAVWNHRSPTASPTKGEDP